MKSQTEKKTQATMNIVQFCFPCCFGNSSTPSLYDDLDDLEFENLLQGHRIGQREPNQTFWSRIAALFKKQQPIYLPDNDIHIPPRRPTPADFLENIEDDAEIMSREDINRKISIANASVLINV